MVLMQHYQNEKSRCDKEKKKWRENLYNLPIYIIYVIMLYRWKWFSKIFINHLSIKAKIIQYLFNSVYVCVVYIAYKYIISKLHIVYDINLKGIQKVQYMYYVQCT